MPSATMPSSPPRDSKAASGSTSYLKRNRCRPPPLEFCAEMNANIRSNPNLDSPYFDLAGHLENRAYCFHNIVYADTFDQTATLLDVGVKSLLPDFMPSPPVSPPRGATFSIRRGDDKHGLGMFAAQNVPVGGIIAVERPMIVVPYIIALQSHAEVDFYTALLHRLSPDAVANFMELANCKPAAECDMLVGIMRTNSIGITLNVPGGPHPELPTHRGIFLNISRCNHSCGPNARWQWDAASFSLSLVALRPIEAGDEITVAYVPPTISRSERRAQLKSLYNFSCRCEFCARPAALTSRSDAARTELETVWKELPSFETWCLNSTIPQQALIDVHKRAVALIEAEGLEMLDYGKHLDAIAMGYGALRDVEQFCEWACRARDFRPPDSDEARVLEGWVADPETFPVWGWRRT
ncbi:SET domain-containing protein 5 [Favolaschia claudopus]|uniref:SET domain-containing protein 5 n=1 Tax=Favolaschia claudopus TaxID=2862362 RepID=A0AAW0AYH4_9AGAR